MARPAMSDKVLPIAMLLLLVLAIVPMAASSLELSEEYGITDDSNPDGSQRVAVDGDGNYHVVYLTDTGGTFAELMYRKVDGTGTTLSGPTRISPSTVDSNYGALAVDVDPAGRVHIAFSVKLESDDARNAYYAQVSSGGSVSVSPRAVEDTNVLASSLDVAADASGNAYVVWNDRSDPPVIKWAKVSSSGSVVGSVEEISGSLGVGGNVAYPRLGASSNGHSYVAWQQKDNQLARTSIYYAHVGPTGDVETGPVQVQSSPLYDESFLEAASDSQGDLHIVYEENGDVEWAVVDDGGSVVEGQQIASSLLGETTAPDVAVAPNDDLYVVWLERANLVNAPWHPFVALRFENNDTWDGPHNVYDGGSGVGIVRVAAGPDSAGVVYLRDGDLYMVEVTPSEENRPPVASLTFSPSDPGVGESVTFDGADSSDPDDGDTVDEYLFEYGDGDSSGWTTSSSITHSYDSAGTYTARLRVRDNHGLESESPASVSVQVTSTPSNRAPTAVLTATPTTVDVGKTVSLNGDSSSDTDGVVTSWMFVFGDGENTGWVTTSVVTHSYDSEGVYTATLQVRDDDGAVSENTATITITVVDTNEPPTATIESITPNPVLQGEDVTFTGSGEDSDGTIAEYVWESDLDLQLSTEASFVRSTLTVGTHTISFKVTDDDGAMSEPATMSLVVKANTPPTLDDLTDTTKTFTDKPVEFRVRYTDVDNDRPTSTKLYYKRGEEGNYKSKDLEAVDTTDRDYTDGKEYFFTFKLKKAGKWKYYFAFENLKNPKKQTKVGEIKVEEPSGPLPGPGPALVASSLLLAATAVTVARRRREERAR